MYTQSITRSHRTAFILAIDQSGSMAEKLLFRGRQTTKAEAVAEVTNRLLFELIERPGAATRCATTTTSRYWAIRATESYRC